MQRQADIHALSKTLPCREGSRLRQFGRRCCGQGRLCLYGPRHLSHRKGELQPDADHYAAVSYTHLDVYKRQVLCSLGCFRGLDLCAQQGAQCREHGVLCRDTGCKGIIKILRYAVSKLCEASVFQQQVDHLCIDTPCVEVLCGLDVYKRQEPGQPETNLIFA